MTFGVIVSLAPLGFNYFHLRLNGQAASLAAVVRNGELFLIVSVMCGVAIGEVIGSGKRMQIAKVIAGFVSFIVGVTCAYLYADIAEIRLIGGVLNDGEIVSLAVRMFLLAFVSCGCCIALSEVGDA